ncbi:MAG TPA: hypothetical protein VFF78_02045 [Anaerolineaceae bacterium]|nr:hypothetical protein [Anaerolineaceae bacterium]
MDPNKYPDIPPRRKSFKRLINQIVMFVAGRALQSLSRSEPLVQHEVQTWPEGFTLMMGVYPHGGSLALTTLPGGKLSYLGSKYDPAKADVVINFKNVEAAFKMFTGQMGVDTGYAQHCMTARGDLSNTVSVVRALNITVSYLFPAFLSARLMKRLPPVPFWRKHRLRLKTYLLGVPFGI